MAEKYVPSVQVSRISGQRIDRMVRALVGAVVSGSTRTVFRHTPLNFDRANGVDTQGADSLRALVTPVHDAVGRSRYEPVSVKHFHFALQQVPAPLERWSFIDIGSGKGRAVLLATAQPFRRVVGVELDPALHAAAQQNLQRYRGPRRCEQVELQCADATTVPLPAGDLVIFFYNSFGGALLRRFLDHLEASLRSEPRRLLFFYSNPVEREQVDGRAAFTPCFDGSSPYDLIWWGCRRLVTYRAGSWP
jgi:SAM-dependent methyltransferase